MWGSQHESVRTRALVLHVALLLMCFLASRARHQVVAASLVIRYPHSASASFPLLWAQYGPLPTTTIPIDGQLVLLDPPDACSPRVNLSAPATPRFGVRLSSPRAYIAVALLSPACTAAKIAVNVQNLNSRRGVGGVGGTSVIPIVGRVLLSADLLFSPLPDGALPFFDNWLRDDGLANRVHLAVGLLAQRGPATVILQLLSGQRVTPRFHDALKAGTASDPTLGATIVSWLGTPKLMIARMGGDNYDANQAYESLV